MDTLYTNTSLIHHCIQNSNQLPLGEKIDNGVIDYGWRAGTSRITAIHKNSTVREGQKISKHPSRDSILYSDWHSVASRLKHASGGLAKTVSPVTPTPAQQS